MSAPELVSGYVIAGKYVVRSLLLHGGAMATYRATGPKSREVAVKLYDPAILGLPDVTKALAQHRSVGAKLSPDQVVPIADSGTDANSGAPFTVTDFEQGPSLSRLVDRGPLPAMQMVALVRNLAVVTDLLHASGIATLSLHPGNVFVRPGAQYEVRVADFGSHLVRMAIPAGERAARWMPWLAPEQIKAQAPATHGADIFALGLVAFFAVAGKPYWRSSQMKTPDAAALRREILGERMPASVRAGEFGISLNPAVDAVLARALAFRAGDRFATARELAVALEAAISGRSVAEVDAARPPTASVSSATVKADAGPAGQRASSSGEAAQGQRLAAPPPRKMPLRATMVGIGSKPEEPVAPAPADAARPKLNTRLGMGESDFEDKTLVKASPLMPAVAAKPSAPVEPDIAKGAAPAKVSPPPMPTAAAKPSPPAMAAAPAKAAPPPMAPAPAKAAPPPMAPAPAKAAPPPMTTAPAKAAPPPMTAAPAVTHAPAMTTAPAISAKPIVTPPAMPAPAVTSAPAVTHAPATTTAPATSAKPIVTPPAMPAPRGGPPPPLPMEPPPAALADVLASFEAAAHDLLPATESPASPLALDLMQGSPAWSPAQPADPGGQRVETGVAVIGSDRAEPPKTSRLRWIAGAAALLLLTGGASWALSGSSPGSRGPAASDAKAAATTPAIAANPPPVADNPSAAAEPQAANVVQQGTEGTPSAASPEPVAPAPPPPAPPPEPVAAEPPPQAADDDTAAQPSSAPRKSAATPTWSPPSAPAAPRAQPSSKPCGKFLKRCK